MARRAGALAADVLGMIAEHVRPGITTGELDRICHDYIVDELKAIPDRSRSAQWEHMVAVTESGFEILTSWPDGYRDYSPIAAEAPLSAAGPNTSR